MNSKIGWTGKFTYTKCKTKRKTFGKAKSTRTKKVEYLIITHLESSKIINSDVCIESRHFKWSAKSSKIVTQLVIMVTKVCPRKSFEWSNYWTPEHGETVLCVLTNCVWYSVLHCPRSSAQFLFPNILQKHLFSWLLLDTNQKTRSFCVNWCHSWYSGSENIIIQILVYIPDNVITASVVPELGCVQVVSQDLKIVEVCGLWDGIRMQYISNDFHGGIL